MSIEPWNTGAGGFADCEDMPRKSIDIRLTDNPIQQKRGNCTLFLPSGEDGFGQSPIEPYLTPLSKIKDLSCVYVSKKQVLHKFKMSLTMGTI